MATLTRPWLRLVALAVGLACMLAYGTWQVLAPHGTFEFAYAPFVSGPLPYSPMRGFTYEQLWGHVRRFTLLGAGLPLFIWGLGQYVRLRAPTDWARLTKLAVAASVLLTAFVMLFILKGRAVADDEISYAMQASFFGDGHFGGPNLGFTPREIGTVPTRLGYSIKYLPGEPLLQVLGVKWGIPALSHLAVVLVTLWAWHRVLSLSSGPAIARLATIALACSPMLIFTSATGLSHASSLMWTVLMGLGVELGRGEKPVRAALLTGLALTFGLMTRPQSIVPIAAVLVPILLVRLWRRRSFTGLAVLALMGAIAAGSLLTYNWLLSGSPFKLPWFLQCGAEHYGFGRVWIGNKFEHTFRTALENLAVVAVRLNAWLLGWPWSLGVVAAWFALGRRTLGAQIWLWVGAAIVAFEFFYYSPGVSDTGSIYHYELVLPFAVMAAVVAQELLARFPERAPLALCCALSLGTGSWLVEQGLRLQRLMSTIHRDSDEALAKIDAPAVLIYERWPGEALARGWVFDFFPKRYRNQSAAVVTLPRNGPDTPAVAARVYPGRSCWYFHYLPGTVQPELLRCADAQGWLQRRGLPTAEEFVVPLLEPSTAYRYSDYFPAAYNMLMSERDSSGAPVRLCCQERARTELGLIPKAGQERQCLETGEP